MFVVQTNMVQGIEYTKLISLDFRLKADYQMGLDTTHRKLLGQFHAYQEAKIRYADFTHKYKIIQGGMVGP